jgi:hypothetical protein
MKARLTVRSERAFTAGFLVLAILAHPAKVLGQSVKTTIKFSKGQADPSVSLVFKQPVHRIVIDLPVAGLLPLRGRPKHVLPQRRSGRDLPVR